MGPLDRDDWYRSYVLKLGKLGLNFPADMFDRASRASTAAWCTRHAQLGRVLDAQLLAHRPLDERDFEWLEEKYPGWYAEYGAFWEAFRETGRPAAVRSS